MVNVPPSVALLGLLRKPIVTGPLNVVPGVAVTVTERLPFDTVDVW